MATDLPRLVRMLSAHLGSGTQKPPSDKTRSPSCSSGAWDDTDSDSERAGGKREGGSSSSRPAAAVPLSQVLAASRVAAIRGATATVGGANFSIKRIEHPSLYADCSQDASPASPCLEC